MGSVFGVLAYLTERRALRVTRVACDRISFLFWEECSTVRTPTLCFPAICGRARGLPAPQAAVNTVFGHLSPAFGSCGNTRQTCSVWSPLSPGCGLHLRVGGHVVCTNPSGPDPAQVRRGRAHRDLAGTV